MMFAHMITNFGTWISRLCRLNRVNGVGIGTARLAPYVYKYFDQGVVDTVVNGSGAVSEESGQLLRRIQTGRVQPYAALLFAGTIFFAGAAIIAARLLTNS